MTAPPAVKARRVLRRVDRPVRDGDEIVTAFRDGRVTLRSLRRSEGFTNADKEIGYHGVEPGDLVVHAMDGFAGAIGVSDSRGKMSPVAHTWRATAGDERYVAYVLRSFAWSGQIASLAKGVRERSTSFDPGILLELDLPWPDHSEQAILADFLDDQVTRLEAAAAAVRHLSDLLEQRPLLQGTERLIEADGSWRTESSWVLAPVSAFFDLELGKMLNEERASGIRLRPYLRNTNVQWDRVDTTNLKEMQFEPGETRRYGLRAGDLLICEGGQPGRAAVWDGRVAEIYFQKALHRARPRRPDVLPRWLLHCLRVCAHSGVFADEGGTTISHLTGEQLRELRLPFPPLQEQRALVEEFDRHYRQSTEALGEAARLQRLLQERKRALITACVTGEFDVSTASSLAGDAAAAYLSAPGDV